MRSSPFKSVCASALKVNLKNIYRTSKMEVKDCQLKEQIEAVHKEHPAYGHKRIAIHLKMNRKRIRRVMIKYGIKPPRRRTKKHYCTKSTDHHNYVNLIKDIKVIDIPNYVWCSDISYFKFKGEFWYLASIEDIATRQVIGAMVGKHHNSELILETIKQALASGKCPYIFHSDQGTEFMASICTEYLERLGVKISVSAKGSPWENGFKESFYGRFKEEFGDINRFETIGELIEEIYQQIYYYNHKRIHTALMMPPAEYASKVAEKSHHKRGT